MAQTISKPNLSRIIPQHCPHRAHSTRTYLPMKMEQTVFRNVGIKFQTPGNHPKESIHQILSKICRMVRGETVQSVRNFPTFPHNVRIFLPDYTMSQQKKAVVLLLAAVTISNLALLSQILIIFCHTQDLFPLCVCPSRSKRTFLIYQAHPRTNHEHSEGQ